MDQIGRAIKKLFSIGPHSEACTELNNASRALIQAYRDEYGQAWLGYINLHAKDRSPEKGGSANIQSVIWKWDGDLVYNFGADFVLPAYNEALAKLILDRDSDPVYSNLKDVQRIETIHTRIKMLNGHFLIWS